jgi:tetratricopeptide (TPR) repeat protein
MAMRGAVLVALVASSGAASAQYVWPKPGYNDSEPGLYTEDPFIVQYRKEFFAVFSGNFARFERAFEKIEGMIQQNPKDARALVWRGNGKMVKAGLALFQNKRDEARALLQESDADLDLAVHLRPDDPNIYMMRAATLLLVHQRFPREWVNRSVYARLLDDSTRFINYIGPSRMLRTSIHLRGEAHASFAIAYEGLGHRSAAVKAWANLARVSPNTTYAEKAQEELARISRNGVSGRTTLAPQGQGSPH